MKCKKCGADLNGEEICPKCGEKQNKEDKIKKYKKYFILGLIVGGVIIIVLIISKFYNVGPDDTIKINKKKNGYKEYVFNNLTFTLNGNFEFEDANNIKLFEYSQKSNYNYCAIAVKRDIEYKKEYNNFKEFIEYEFSDEDNQYSERVEKINNKKWYVYTAVNNKTSMINYIYYKAPDDIYSVDIVYITGDNCNGELDNIKKSLVVTTK